MHRHRITETELDEWMSDQRTRWVQFAASSSLESNKRLEVSLGGEYRVTDAGAVSYLGTDKSAAIRAYNDAR